MEGLLEKGNMTLAPSDSFMSQVYEQGRNQMADGNSSLVNSERVMFAMVQACKKSAATVLDISLLTNRELEILGLLGTGLSVKGTARGLEISPGTVKWHVKNIYYKLGASSREDALLKARMSKIIQ